jgi:hypothetical protein
MMTNLPEEIGVRSQMGVQSSFADIGPPKLWEIREQFVEINGRRFSIQNVVICDRKGSET